MWNPSKIDATGTKDLIIIHNQVFHTLSLLVANENLYQKHVWNDTTYEVITYT